MKAMASGAGVVCRWVLAIALVIGLGVLCEAAVGVTTSTAQIGQSGQIDQLAMQIATSAGDPNPTSVTWVETNQFPAGACFYDLCSPPNPYPTLYVLDIRGKFDGRITTLQAEVNPTSLAWAGGVAFNGGTLAQYGRPETDSLVGRPASTSQAALLPSAASVSGFIHLAQRGLAGTFTATYLVTGLPIVAGTSTVRVAQRAGAGSRPWSGGRGEWSFLLTGPDGFNEQWIQYSARRVDACGAMAGQSLFCYATSQYFAAPAPSSIGLAAFVPGDEFQEMDAAADAIGQGTRRVSVFNESGGKLGTLECLRASSFDGLATWCLNAGGVLASVNVADAIGFASWTTAKLVDYSSSAEPAMFDPEVLPTGGHETCPAFLPC